MIKNTWLLLGILLLTGCLSACSSHSIYDSKYGNMDNPGILSPYFIMHAKITRDENGRYRLANFCMPRSNDNFQRYTRESQRHLPKFRDEYVDIMSAMEKARQNVTCDDEIANSRQSPWDSLYVHIRRSMINIVAPAEYDGNKTFAVNYISVPEECYASPDQCLKKNEFLEFTDKLDFQGFYVNYQKASRALDEALSNVPMEEYFAEASKVKELDSEFLKVANPVVNRLSEMDKLSREYRREEKEKKRKEQLALELREAKNIEVKRKKSQKSLFRSLSKNKKELGDQVCTLQNDFGYVERVSKVKIQIRVKGSALDQEDYLFFTPESIKYSYVNKDDIIWDQSSSWAACTFTR